MSERSGLIINENQSAGGDLTDSPKDQEKLKPEESEVQIPELKDIPGQEHIRPVPLKGLSDTTASSDGEEGKGLVENLNKADDDEELIVSGNDTDISAEEVRMLEGTDGFELTEDNQNLQAASLESKDMAGDELNADSFGEDLSGADLDVPAAELDDALEEIGEEDEENNIYSPDTEDEDKNVGNS